MSDTDTSAEAVEHRAADLETWGLGGANRAAATLRDLLVERDAARAEAERLREALREARREGFLAALEMAERRCEDAARYVRLRARSGEDHTVANTYEQAGAMVRALPVPDAFRAPTGLEYRGG